MLRGIHRAVESGDLAAVERLVAKGANIEERETRGTTPLIRAAVRGHLAIVRYLLSAGANPNEANEIGYTALMGAARDGQLEIAKELVAAGANVEYRDNEGTTALHVAAAYPNHSAFIAYLLEAGAEVNSTQSDGRTPLMRAAGAGSVDNIEALLKGGAELHSRDAQGRTPLDWALSRDRPEAAAYLRNAMT